MYNVNNGANNDRFFFEIFLLCFFSLEQRPSSTDSLLSPRANQLKKAREDFFLGSTPSTSNESEFKSSSTGTSSKVFKKSNSASKSHDNSHFRFSLAEHSTILEDEAKGMHYFTFATCWGLFTYYFSGFLLKSILQMILDLHGLVHHLQRIHPKFLEREKLEQDPKCMKNKDKNT